MNTHRAMKNIAMAAACVALLGLLLAAPAAAGRNRPIPNELGQANPSDSAATASVVTPSAVSGGIWLAGRSGQGLASGQTFTLNSPSCASGKEVTACTYRSAYSTVVCYNAAPNNVQAGTSFKATQGRCECGFRNTGSSVPSPSANNLYVCAAYCQ